MERSTLGDIQHRGGERSQAPWERDLGVVRVPAAATAASRPMPVGHPLWDPTTGRFDPSRLRAAIQVLQRIWVAVRTVRNLMGSSNRWNEQCRPNALAWGSQSVPLVKKVVYLPSFTPVTMNFLASRT